MSDHYQCLLERFLRYVKVDTTAGDGSRGYPSSPGQLELGRMLLDELRAIEAAWQRLQDGSYGICVDCGGDVGYERLKANPAAARDIQCQERHEKTYGGNPKPSL